MALAGLRLRLRAAIRQRAMEPLFDRWNRNPEKREVARLMRAMDRKALSDSGAVESEEIPERSGLLDALRHGARMAAVVGRPGNLHWVAVLVGDERSAFVHDPYFNGSPGDLARPRMETAVDWDDFMWQTRIDSRGTGCVIEFAAA